MSYVYTCKLVSKKESSITSSSMKSHKNSGEFDRDFMQKFLITPLSIFKIINIIFLVTY